jgi:hypothetical protein
MSRLLLTVIVAGPAYGQTKNSLTARKAPGSATCMCQAAMSFS